MTSTFVSAAASFTLIYLFSTLMGETPVISLIEACVIAVPAGILAFISRRDRSGANGTPPSSKPSR